MKTLEVDYPANVVKFEPAGMDILSASCKAFDVAVHAGRNRTWPSHLSLKFGAVFTFEPDLERLIDLCAETTRPNVFAMRAMLGDHFGPVTMNTVRGIVTVPMFRVDDLNLEHCDAIVVEDAKDYPRVINGAVKTFERFRPVVMVEEHVLTRRQLREPLLPWRT